MDDRQKILISPQTKVAELLDAFPELEAVLIEIAPPFKKLRNPVLRRTVARVTSLSQAARVGNVPIADLVRRLRQAVGQPEYESGASAGGSAAATSPPRPDWLDRSRVTETIDARPMIDAGEQPLGMVMQTLGRLSGEQILELITPFEPAPLIDTARKQGYQVWTTKQGADDFRTYFMRG